MEEDSLEYKHDFFVNKILVNFLLGKLVLSLVALERFEDKGAV